MDGGNKARYRG